MFLTRLLAKRSFLRQQFAALVSVVASTLVPVALPALVPAVVHAQTLGGFLEQPLTLTTALEPVLSATEVNGFVPQRGAFTFPAPYNTRGVRLTNGTDCGGKDCVNAIGYSYWRNINNHIGQDSMLIMVGLDKARGGAGLTLLQYNKVTEEVKNLGPIFDANSPYGWGSGEGWYFSGVLPTKLLLNNGSSIYRYDVMTKQMETLFDVTSRLGAGRVLHQMSSSNDDRVFAATVRNSSTYEMLGCMAYEVDTAKFHWFPKKGDFDECQLDRSGQWLVIKENVDAQQGEDNRIIKLADDSERLLNDRDGAGGHSDMGFGYMVAADNFASTSNTTKVWDFNQSTLKGTVVYSNNDWNAFMPSHVSHTNAGSGAPSQQFACGSSANRRNSAEANEVICFRLDGSKDVLVVAPVMSSLDSRSGGDYDNSPKGNLDITGEYFIWTSNMGGSRLDAFIVKVPKNKLMNGTSVLPTSPTGTTSPTTTTSTPTTSTPTTTTPTTTTTTDITAPVISSIVASPYISEAQISVTTSEPAVTSVEYGVSSSYGSTSGSSSLTSSGAINVNGLDPSTLYHYRVISRDAAGNVATSDDYVMITGAQPVVAPGYVATATPVAWGDLVNTNFNSTGSIQKVSGCDGCDDAGAASEQQIGKTGYLEFKATIENGLRFVGLSDSNNNTTANDIDFGLRLQGAVAEVRENGTYRADSSFKNNDVFRISVNAGKVSYAKNGVVFYTSTQAPAALLRADTAFASAKTTIINAVIAGLPTMLGEWGLDTALIANDDSGNNWLGAVKGGATAPHYGPVGSALTLDGIDDFVEVPHVQALNSYPLTISAWVKTGTSSMQAIVNKYLPESRNGYQLFFNNGALCAWYYRDATNNVSDGSSCPMATTGVNDNRWHHVAFTVDATGGTLYVDGKTTGHQKWNGTAGPATTTQALSFGRYPGSASQYLNGLIDEVRVYSRSATAVQIAAYFASVPPAPTTEIPVTTTTATSSTSSTSSTAAQPLVWTNLVNLSALGSSVSKTSGCDGCADAGATSAAQIKSGNGYIEFTATVEDKLRTIGLTGINATTTDADIRFGVRLQNGIAEVREGGVYKGDTAFLPGDVFRIAVQNGVVSYLKNGVALYASTLAPVYPLRADTAFYSTGGSIKDATMRTDTP